MTVRLIQCPTCQATYRTEEYPTNRRYRCPNCNCKFVVPGEDVQDELIGQDIGGCTIDAKIGEGGMGRIYKATHQALRKKVAIKILPNEFAANERYVTRFLREARSAARVEHPNIVQVLNVGQDKGYHFIIMQYIQGTDLDTIIKKRGRLMPDEALRIVEQATEGLVEIEKQGLVHRDIKPSNLLVTHGGHVFITDFGLARSAVDPDELAQSGKVVGTPYFMSPEQCDGRLTDIRGDLYALGATFYYLLTGRKPFEGETPHVVIYKHRFVEVIPPSTIFTDIPTEVSNIIVRMMAKKPEERYASAQELLEELRKAESDIQFDTTAAVARLGQMVPDSLSGSTTIIMNRSVRESRYLVLMVALGLGLAVLTLLVVLLLNKPAKNLVATRMDFDKKWERAVPEADGLAPKLFFTDPNPARRDVYVLMENIEDPSKCVVRKFAPGPAAGEPAVAFENVPGPVHAVLLTDQGKGLLGLSGDARQSALFTFNEAGEATRQMLSESDERITGLPPFAVYSNFFLGATTRSVLYSFCEYDPASARLATVIGLAPGGEGAAWAQPGFAAVTHVTTYQDPDEQGGARHILVVDGGKIVELDARKSGVPGGWAGTTPKEIDLGGPYIIEHLFIVNAGAKTTDGLAVLYAARLASDTSEIKFTGSYMKKEYRKQYISHGEEYLFLARFDGQLLWDHAVKVKWGGDAEPVVVCADLDGDGALDIVINAGPGLETSVLRRDGTVAVFRKLGRLIGVDEVSAKEKHLMFVTEGQTPQTRRMVTGYGLMRVEGKQ